jgi:hypothetical protein
VRIGQIATSDQQRFPSLFVGGRWRGEAMKIACCTLEMITLIFLLFWSFNGAHSVVSAPSTNLVSQPTTELVSAWGEPDSVSVAADLGFETAQLETVEIWSYANPARSVVVRDDTVVSIRVG